MDLKKRLGQYARSARMLVSGADSSRPYFEATLRKVGLARPFMPTPAAIDAYKAVIAEKVALIEHLPSQYGREAYALIWNRVMRGFDTSGLARELSEQFGFTPDRAKRVAQSQCKMAHAVMENAARTETGIREAVWHTEKRCAIRSHRGLHGRKYILENGVSLDGKSIWPGSEPECYCSSITIRETEDEQ